MWSPLTELAPVLAAKVLPEPEVKVLKPQRSRLPQKKAAAAPPGGFRTAYQAAATWMYKTTVRPYSTNLIEKPKTKRFSWQSWALPRQQRIHVFRPNIFKLFHYFVVTTPFRQQPLNIFRIFLANETLFRISSFLQLFSFLDPESGSYNADPCGSGST